MRPNTWIPTGAVFGKWIVIESGLRYGKNQYRACRVRCACGYERITIQQVLIDGDTTMCRSCAKTTHGKHNSSEYRIYRAMLNRCYNKNHVGYPDYGARGVVVCDDWLRKRTGFSSFLQCVGSRPTPKHSLDRIDTNGNYEPGNVRWVTVDVQANNRRDNRKVEFAGKVQTPAQWAHELGIHTSTLHNRLNVLNWTVERALTTPRRSRGSK